MIFLGYKLLTLYAFIFIFSLLQGDPVQGLIHYLQNYGHNDKKLKKGRKTEVRGPSSERGRAVIQI